MRNGWIAFALVAGALLGTVGGAALLNATRGQATLLSYELAPEEPQEIRVLVGVGRLLVVITTNDPKVAAAAIDDRLT